MPYKNPDDQKAAARRHYEANKELMKARAKAHREKQRRELRNFVRAIKNRPCMDCGVSYPFYVMQFDHRDANSKSFSIGTCYSSGKSIRVVEEEISKCDVVCANCHAERTYQRASLRGQDLNHATSGL